VDDPRILHLRYADFIADPVATVQRYYAFCGRTVTHEAESAMRAYLANNRGDRYGKFRYSTQLLIDIAKTSMLYTPNSGHSVSDSVSRSRTAADMTTAHQRLSVHNVTFLGASPAELEKHWTTLVCRG